MIAFRHKETRRYLFRICLSWNTGEPRTATHNELLLRQFPIWHRGQTILYETHSVYQALYGLSIMYLPDNAYRSVLTFYLKVETKGQCHTPLTWRD